MSSTSAGIKAVKRHEERLKNPRHVWTKTEINSLAKCIGSARWENDWTLKAAKLNLLTLINENGYRITKEQSDFGKAFLYSKLFNSKGQFRRSQVASQFREWRGDIVKRLTKFTFDGFHVEWNSYTREINSLAPVYSAYDRKGQRFSYAWVHWGPVFIDNDLNLNDCPQVSEVA